MLIQAKPVSKRRRFLFILLIAAFSLILIPLRKILADVLVIVGGGAIIAFLVLPLANWYEHKLPRNLSSLCALLTCLCALLLAAWFLLPLLASEILLLAKSLPESIKMLQTWFQPALHWMKAYLPGVSLPSALLQGSQLPKIAQSTIHFAGSIADFFYRFSLMVVLGYFLLYDRSRVLIRLELLIPKSVRKTAVAMGIAIVRELKLYLRAQGLIAAIVGTLSAIGLALIGVRSALVLGIIIGILNMIPYFGPVIGAIPAVLMALNSGLMTALFAAGVLWIVQQIDSTLISPRIMSSLSGISPAIVLLAIFIGSGLGGIVGMLLAIPTVMTYRTVFRVFVQRHKNV